MSGPCGKIEQSKAIVSHNEDASKKISDFFLDESPDETISRNWPFPAFTVSQLNPFTIFNIKISQHLCISIFCQIWTGRSDFCLLYETFPSFSFLPIAGSEHCSLTKNPPPIRSRNETRQPLGPHSKFPISKSANL